MTNIEKYNAIFIELFDCTQQDLDGGFAFNDIERWDSLLHMALIGKLEEAFDIMFDTMDILNYESYQNGLKILRKYGVEI